MVCNVELNVLGSLDVAAVVLFVPENIFADVIPPVNVIDVGYQICMLIIVLNAVLRLSRAIPAVTTNNHYLMLSTAY